MFKSSSNFRALLDKATSAHNLENDWTSIMAICDLIRSGEVSCSYAMDHLQTRLASENPHVQRWSVTVLESIVKNCGRRVIQEVDDEEFMAFLRQKIMSSPDEIVRNQLLAMIQSWSNAFSEQEVPAIKHAYDMLYAEGWDFPSNSASGQDKLAAMFESNVAPEWHSSDVCSRCRLAFSLLNRQHHCRACGYAYCARCSNNFCPLPLFGIEKPVRVCDACFERTRSKATADSAPRQSADDGRSSESDSSSSAAGNKVRQQIQQRPKDQASKKESQLPTEEEEEEQLQLALALSQSEAEASANKKRVTFDHSPPAVAVVSKANSDEVKSRGDNEMSSIDNDFETLSPELYRYLNRDYWSAKEKDLADQQGSSTQKTAAHCTEVQRTAEPPTAVESTYSHSDASSSYAPSGQVSDSADLSQIRRQIETFTNRIKSNAARGRSIAHDQSVQTMLVNIMDLHSSLFERIKVTEEERNKYEVWQDKVSQIRDGRAALDALRAEDLQRRQIEKQHADAMRQMQLNHKLTLLRQEKQQKLQLQHQMALEKLTREQRTMGQAAVQPVVNVASMISPSILPGPPPGSYDVSAYQQPLSYAPGPPAAPIQQYSVPVDAPMHMSLSQLPSQAAPGIPHQVGLQHQPIGFPPSTLAHQVQTTQSSSGPSAAEAAKKCEPEIGELITFD